MLAKKFGKNPKVLTCVVAQNLEKCYSDRSLEQYFASE